MNSIAAANSVGSTSNSIDRAAGFSERASLERLEGLSPQQLRNLRISLAQVLHPKLVQLATQGFAGLFISDAPCLGKIPDAFAFNNGSSKYLNGYLSKATQTQTADNTKQESATPLANCKEFLHSKSELVSAGIIVGVREEEGRFFSYVDALDGIGPVSQIEVRQTGDTLADRERLAIGGLLSLSNWLIQDGGVAIGPEEIDPLFNSASQASCEAIARSLEQSDKIRLTSRQALFELCALVPELPNIAVGESFTFGKLSNLLAEGSQAKQPTLAYGWYHPSFKQAVGVPASLVSEELIAEPETVHVGAKQLLTAFGEIEGLALATSGWANFSKSNQADFFSIGLQAKQAGKEGPYALRRFTVTKTQDLPLTLERREITRELGVAVAISMLFEHIERVYPDKKSILLAQHQAIDSLIRSYGTYD